jgi:hypothetical protein
MDEVRRPRGGALDGDDKGHAVAAPTGGTRPASGSSSPGRRQRPCSPVPSRDGNRRHLPRCARGTPVLSPVDAIATAARLRCPTPPGACPCSHGHVTGSRQLSDPSACRRSSTAGLPSGGKSHWHTGSRLAPKTSSFLEPPRAVISRSTSTRSGAAATSGLPRRSWRVSSAPGAPRKRDALRGAAWAHHVPNPRRRARPDRSQLRYLAGHGPPPLLRRHRRRGDGSPPPDI